MSQVARLPRVDAPRYEVHSAQEAHQAFRRLCKAHTETLQRMKRAQTAPGRERLRVELIALDREIETLTEEWFRV